MTKVGSKAQSDQKSAAIGHVVRGAGGRIEMIEFREFESNPLAQHHLVDGVNAVYYSSGIITCTYGLIVPTRSGLKRCIEVVNTMWSESAWVEATQMVHWAKGEFVKGTFENAHHDDGGGRRPRTQ